MKNFLIKIACIPLLLVCTLVFIYALLTEPWLLYRGAMIGGGIALGKIFAKFIIEKFNS